MKLFDQIDKAKIVLFIKWNLNFLRKILKLRTKRSLNEKSFYSAHFPSFSFTIKFSDINKGVNLSISGLNYFLNYDKIYKKIDKHFGKAFNNIVILKGNSGEVSLLLASFFSNFCQNNKLYSNNTIVLCSKKYHVQLVKIFFPELTCQLYFDPLFYFLPKKIKTKDRQLYVFFTTSYFSTLERLTRENKIYSPNFVQWMRANYKLESSLNNIRIECGLWRRWVEQNFPRKVLLLCPESKSCDSLPNFFWERIETHLKGVGITYYFNSNSKVRKSDNIFLSYEQLVVLCKFNKLCALGVRSGLFDFLSLQPSNLFILYNGFPYRNFDFPNLSSDKVIKIFSLASIALRNSSLIEVDVNSRDINYLIEEVIVWVDKNFLEMQKTKTR